MPDITKCYGESCPSKENCYRFTATPNEYRQAYWMHTPIIEEPIGAQSCQYFMPNKEGHINIY